MTSHVVDVNECVVGKDKKRKNNEVVDEVKKKKKNKHVETVDEKPQTDEVVKKVKKKKINEPVEEEREETDAAMVKVKTKKKKNKQIQPDETEGETDEVKEENGNNDITNSNKIDNKSKQTKVKELPTVSIAVPGSILDNAQSPELRTYLAGQIARAACIYKIDEIIVFDDVGEQTNVMVANKKTEGGSKTCKQLAVILQYLECPQYLRRLLFPIHNFLRCTGVLNPLDAPHHFRQEDNVLYREGVVSTLPPKNGKGCNVDVGLRKHVLVDKCLQPYVRVTVKLIPNSDKSKRQKGIVVAPSTPKNEAGIYWGYTVRNADSINKVFTKCPYPGGYDLKIGTSDKGVNIDETDHKQLTNFKHALICFGGVHGLEAALESDVNIDEEDPSTLFDVYLNTCPNQGSRTIRTEEAIFITLAELRSKINIK